MSDDLSPPLPSAQTRLAFGPRPIGSTTTQSLTLNNREDEALEFAFGRTPVDLPESHSGTVIKVLHSGKTCWEIRSVK